MALYNIAQETAGVIDRLPDMQKPLMYGVQEKIEKRKEINAAFMEGIFIWIISYQK